MTHKAQTCILIVDMNCFSQSLFYSWSLVNCGFNLHRFVVFFEIKTKIFTVMYFVEPIVPLFAIYYLNMNAYLLFTNILFHTIYSLKFLQSCFCSIIRTLYNHLTVTP